MSNPIAIRPCILHHWVLPLRVGKMIRLARILAIAVAAAIISQASLADETVPFIADSEIPENDWQAIVRYQETSPTGRHDSDAFGIPIRERSMTLAQAKRWFRNEKLVVGYVDISGDGQDEMFAYIRGLGFCGSAGCNTIAFGKRGGKWVAFAELYSHIGQRGVSLHLTDKKIDSHRTIYARHAAWEWTGNRYHSIDIKDCQYCKIRSQRITWPRSSK